MPSRRTLQTTRKSREAIVSTAADRMKGLLPRLHALATSSGDQRAETAAIALAGKKPDLDALRRVLEASAGESMDEGVKVLRQAAMLAPAPSREAVAAATRELREAVAAVEQNHGTDAGRARALAQLLDHAIRYHAAHATSNCPVCGTSGALGGTWRDDRRPHCTSSREPTRQTGRIRAWTARRLLRTRCSKCRVGNRSGECDGDRVSRRAGMREARRRRVDLVIHGRKGRFRSKDSYGNETPRLDREH
jgi:hypothetical protein